MFKKLLSYFILFLISHIIALANDTLSNNFIHIQRITSGGTNLYGYLSSAPDEISGSWCKFLQNDIEIQWTTENEEKLELLTPWTKDNSVCGYSKWYKYGYLWGLNFYSLDLFSGNLLDSRSDEDCIYDGGIFFSCVYDPEDKTLYGYATNEYEATEFSTSFFQRAGNYPFGYEVIKNIDRSNIKESCKSLCYNPEDKSIYGITFANDLVKIEKSTGQQTLIKHLDVDAIKEFTGMTFSSSEKKFYWNYIDNEKLSHIISFLPSGDEIVNVIDFEKDYKFSYLVELETSDSPSSPGRPSIENINFSNGSTSGYIVYKMPEKLSDGSPITEEMEWYSIIDGVQYKKGNALGGESVKIIFSSLSEGVHNFAFFVSLNGMESTEVVSSFYIGNDTPCSPTDILLESDGISWEPVTSGIHNGYIDLNSISYDIYIDGNYLTSTNSNFYTFNVGEGSPYALHQATVTASFKGHTSEAGVSNTLKAGDPWRLPFKIQASETSFPLLTIQNIDEENDHTWVYDSDAFYSGPAEDVPGDDWLILPPIAFNSIEETYSLYVNCKQKAETPDGSCLEVFLGTSPDRLAMNTPLIESFYPGNEDYEYVNNPSFSINSTGTYYIGLHAKTPIGALGILIKDIILEESRAGEDSPEPVPNLNVKPGENGKLEARVTFSLPSKTLLGRDIPSDTLLKAYVEGRSTIVKEGHPGELLNVIVPTNQGINTISVIAEYNGNLSERSFIDVYTGENIPGNVKNFSCNVTDDMMVIDLSWESPDSEVSGGYVNPETTEYNVSLWNSRGLIAEEKIETGCNNYRIELPEDANQDIYRIVIIAENIAGRSSKTESLEVLAGCPYSLPVTWDFEEDDSLLPPWLMEMSETSNITWNIYPIKDIWTQWHDYNGKALCALNESSREDESTLVLPRFSTENMGEVKVTFKVWTGSGSSMSSVLVRSCDNVERKILASFPYSDSSTPEMWKSLVYILPSNYLNEKWIEISVKSEFSGNRQSTIIDSISINGEQDEVVPINYDEGSLYIRKGKVILNGFDKSEVTIYRIDGIRVYNCLIENPVTEINLDKGFYIIRVSGKIFKIMVL